MPIVGLTDHQRLTRLGKIRLGYMAETQGGEKYPRATDYFVVPEEVAAEYGEMPTTLDPILFPVDVEDIFASTFYRLYTQTWGLTCKGNGDTANRLVDKAQLEATGEPVPASHATKETGRLDIQCPCPLLDKGYCRPIMNLQFLLPEVSGLGVWQVDTSSYNSIRNVLDCVRTIREVRRYSPDGLGRGVAMLPLKLSLRPMEVHPPGGGKKTVHVLHLEMSKEMRLADLVALEPGVPPITYELPEPDDEVLMALEARPAGK